MLTRIIIIILIFKMKNYEIDYVKRFISTTFLTQQNQSLHSTMNNSYNHTKNIVLKHIFIKIKCIILKNLYLSTNSTINFIKYWFIVSYLSTFS